MPVVGVFPPRCSLPSFFSLFLSLSLSLSLSPSLSLSLSLSVAFVLALALARFVPVTEGAWAHVPSIFLAHGANRTSIFKKKPSCGHIGVSLACVLCCVWIVSGVVCFRHLRMLEFPGHLCCKCLKCWPVFRIVVFWAIKNTGISRMFFGRISKRCLFLAFKHAEFQSIWCLGLVNILDFPGRLDF